MAQIKLSIEDLKNQQIRMSSLAERLDAQTQRYYSAIRRLKSATEGKYSLNMACKATVTLKMMQELTSNIRMGAHVAQTCIDRFQATDSDLANKTNPANPENVMKQTMPAYGSVLASPRTTNIANSGIGVLKNYQTPAVSYNGHDYSGYKVVNVYDQEYIFKQSDIRWKEQLLGSDGNNAGCVVSSEAMVNNMAHPESKILPTDCGDKGGCICTYKYTHKTPDYLKANTSVKKDIIYETINSGSPGMVRLQGHTVVAIGIRDGATKGSISNNDILIIDPADGLVKTIAEAGYGDIDIDSNLWVANK